MSALPGGGGQSGSLLLSQPVGQQPSPPVHIVIAVFAHATLQFAALPTTTSFVQTSPSPHDAGQLSGGSQVSFGPTTPSPHDAEQSASVALEQPVGQQPSPGAQSVTAAHARTSASGVAECSDLQPNSTHATSAIRLIRRSCSEIAPDGADSGSA